MTCIVVWWIASYLADQQFVVESSALCGSSPGARSNCSLALNWQAAGVAWFGCKCVLMSARSNRAFGVLDTYFLVGPNVDALCLLIALACSLHLFISFSIDSSQLLLKQSLKARLKVCCHYNSCRSWFVAPMYYSVYSIKSHQLTVVTSCRQKLSPGVWSCMSKHAPSSRLPSKPCVAPLFQFLFQFSLIGWADYVNSVYITRTA